MAFRITPDPGDPGAERVGAGSVGGAEAQLELRLMRDGLQIIATGTMACPSCELPMPAAPAMPASAQITCPWCGHTARAREALRESEDGAPASSARLVARLR